MNVERATPAPPSDALAALERRCRNSALVAWSGFAMAAFVVLVLLLQRLGEEGAEIRAQAFVLEDFEGRERASLELPSGEQDLRLLLRDMEGRRRLMLQVSMGGLPTLQFWDEDGRVRLGLGLLFDGAPILNLVGADGTPRATLRADRDTGRLMVREGTEGEPRIFSSAGEER